MRGMTLKALALAATALAPVAPALAQATADEEANAGDIVVTARRVEERLQDVPISITVFNQEQLASRNIVNSTDLAIYTPSLSANSRFGTEKATFAIRSFSQDINTAPTVGVYFADVVAPRLASNIPSGGGAGVGLMFDLQNVQVLKGPQGTLFGRNTTGGAILLVPQKPTDRLEGYVEGTYGTYNARRLQAVVNVPISDSLRIRLGVDRNVRDGYINNRSGIGPDKFNNVNYWSARASVDADLSDSLENYTVFQWSHTDTTGMLGVIKACNRGTIPGTTGSTAPTRALACAQLDRVNAAGYGFYDAEGNMPDPFVIQKFWQLINTTTWQATDSITVKNIFSFARAKESYAFNITGDYFPGIFVTNTHPGPRTNTQDNRRNITEELQILGTAMNDRLTWQMGGYLELSDPVGGAFGTAEQYTAVYTQGCLTLAQIHALQCGVASVAGSISVSRNVYQFSTYGVYGQATYKLNDKFALTLGIRNTWESASVDGNNVRIVPTLSGVPARVTCSRAATPVPNPGVALIEGNLACTRSFKTSSNRPTWLINLDYKPNEDTLIYAKWARGYRGGSVAELTFGFETWGPEKLDLYEVGLKASFDGTLRGNLNVAAFWNELRDQQVPVFIPACFPTGAPGDLCTNPAPTGASAIVNVASSRIRGLEMDGTFYLWRGFRLDFGYAYLDAKVTNGGAGGLRNCDSSRFFCSQAAFPAVGTRALFAPEQRVTLTATYDLPFPPNLGDVSIGATYVYTTEYIQSTSNTPAFLRGAIPEDYGRIPAVGLLNMNLTWKKIAQSNFDLSLFVTNLTGEEYRIASAGGLPSTGAEYVLVGEPRMFGARLRYNFGR
jgi:iron complex outermembrane recepter protein